MHSNSEVTFSDCFIREYRLNLVALQLFANFDKISLHYKNSSTRPSRVKKQSVAYPHGFLCDWYMEHRTALDWMLLENVNRGNWPFLARDSTPSGLGIRTPAPVPPAQISQGSYQSHAFLMTSSDGLHLKHYLCIGLQFVIKKSQTKIFHHGVRSLFHGVVKQKCYPLYMMPKPLYPY